jgi:tetratricopeptide (TPR) repeat protein
MEEEQDNIDNYLTGNVSEPERTAFEQRLQTDESLRAVVEEQTLLREGIARASRKEILQSLRELEASLPAAEAPAIPLWRNAWLQVAAGVSLLTVCAYLLWPTAQEPATLFADYFEPYPNVIMPTVRGAVENDSTVKAQAFRAYDRQEYTKAIELFETLNLQDATALLYLGNSYLASGQPEKALPLLEKVLNNYDVFHEQAEWYIAISYLKLEERDKAKEALRKVVVREGSYKSKAQLILEKLN